MIIVTRFFNFILFGILTINLKTTVSDKSTSRAIDVPMVWRPVQVPLNPNQPSLISVNTLDGTNKAQLLQIAQHNANVMRQIKGLTPPSTPYYNSYQSSTPVYHSQNRQNGHEIKLNSFGSNNGKHSFSSKPEYPNIFNAIHSSTQKIPGVVKSPQQQTYQHFQQQNYQQQNYQQQNYQRQNYQPQTHIQLTLQTHQQNVNQQHHIQQQHHHQQQQQQQHQLQQQQKQQQLQLQQQHQQQQKHQLQQQQQHYLSNPQQHGGQTANLPQQYQNAQNQQQIFNVGNYRGISSNADFRDVTLTPPPPPPSSPSTAKPTQTPHPVLSKLQAHLDLAIKQSKQPSPAQSTRFENFIPSNNVISSYSSFVPSASFNYNSNAQSYSTGLLNNQLTSPSVSTYNKFYGSNFDGFSKNQYLPPNGAGSENFAQQNLPGVSSTPNSVVNNQNQYKIGIKNTVKEETTFAPFPSIPPSVLSPFFQQIQQQQNENHHVYTHQGYNSFGSNTEQPNKYEFSETYPKKETVNTQVNDEYTRNLVPPPLYKHTDSVKFRASATPSVDYEAHNEKPNSEIINKHVVKDVSPLQDANRYAYKTGSSNNHQYVSSTTPLSTFSELLYPPSIDPPISFNTYITTEKPNVFKHLTHLHENDFKLHKVMHPSYTGARHPNDYPHLRSSTFLPTPTSPDENNAITHSFFTIEDAVTNKPTKSQTSAKEHLSASIPDSSIKNYEFNIEQVNLKEAFDFNQSNQNNNHKQIHPVKEDVDDFYYNNYYDYSTVQPYSQTTPTEPPSTTSSTTTTITTSTTTSPPPPATTTIPEPQFSQNISTKPRERSKIRRRRPKPPRVNIETLDSESAYNAPTNDISETISSNSNKRHHNRGRPITTEIPISSTSSRHRRPLNQTPSQFVDTDVLTTNNQYLKEVTPTTNRRPVISTTVQSSSPQVISTIQPSPDYALFNKNNIKSTEQNDISETTTYIRPQTERNRIRHPTTTHIMTTNFDDQYYTSPETTNYIQQEIDNGADTTLPNTVTFTNSNNGGSTTTVESIRNLSRLRHKDGKHSSSNVDNNNIAKQPTAFEENVTEYLPSTNRIHSKLSNIRPTQSSTSTTTSTTTTTTSTTETPPPSPRKSNRIKPTSPYDASNRPRFSVKEYRQKIATSTTESPSLTSEVSTHTRLRFPSRNRFLNDLNKSKSKETVTTTSSPVLELEINNTPVEEVVEPAVETSTETRTRFQPKQRTRFRSTTDSPSTTESYQSSTSRRGVNTRRDFISRNRVTTSTSSSFENDYIVPSIRPSSQFRRPPTVSLKQRIQNFRKKEENSANKISSNEITSSENINMKMDDNLSEEQNNVEQISVAVPPELVTDGYRRETSIMKIAKDDHSYRPYSHQTQTESSQNNDNDLSGSPSDYSQRVAELTISGHSDFKSVNTGILSRRVPGYFTIATEDPILPIEAFFPQVKKD